MAIALVEKQVISGDYTGYLTRVAYEEEYYSQVDIVKSPLKQVIESPLSGVPFNLPSGWDDVTSVQANGVTYTRAKNPANPNSREFVVDPYTHQIRVYFSGELRSLIIYGDSAKIEYTPSYLPQPYPLLFTSLPLQGTIQLNRQFEGQPGGSFEMESTLPKSALQNLLAPGTEVEVYGLPLRINNIAITELPRSVYPDGRVKISGTMGSKWENYINEPVFLRSDGQTQYNDTEPFRDTQCVNPQGNNYNKDPNNQVPITELFRRAGMKLSGVALKPVVIPPDTLQDATVNPLQLMTERLRLANAFVRWSSSNSVEIVPIGGTKQWYYKDNQILGEIQTTYDADAKLNKKAIAYTDLNPTPPDLVNFSSTVTAAPLPNLTVDSDRTLGFEYPNVEVSGDFKTLLFERVEITQGQQPRFTRRSSKRTTRLDGDPNAHQVPDGTTAIKALSMCFDNGGETRSRQYVTEEDGAEVQIVSEVWGFAFIADDVYDPESPQYINGNSGAYWLLVRRTQTEFLYDENTGYLTKILESGFQLVRWRKETASIPETLTLEVNSEEYNLYKFFRIPVVKRTSYDLELLPQQDISEGLYEIVKFCNKDGSSTPSVLINPDYAPKYYIKRSRTEVSGFAWLDNPANEGLDPVSDKLSPPLTVGEESKFETSINIIPAVYKEYLVDSETIGGRQVPVFTRGEEITPQKYVKYITKFSVSGQDMTESISEESIENGVGDPPLGQLRPPRFKFERQPASVVQQYHASKLRDEPKYRYLIQTPGYKPTDPIGGSESFPNARTWEEAQIALLAKLNIENWRSGAQETLQIPANLQIKEGDRFTYLCNGETRHRVVLGVQHDLQVLGVLDGSPSIAATTSLTLGRYFDPPLEFSWSAVEVPRDIFDVRAFVVTRQRIGGILPWANIRGRRNY